MHKGQASQPEEVTDVGEPGTSGGRDGYEMSAERDAGVKWRPGERTRDEAAGVTARRSAAVLESRVS